MKKFIICTLVLAMLAGLLSGCIGGRRDDDMYLIGILQFLDHPALDAARSGFEGRLAELGFVEGENVEFIFRNAGRDAGVAATMSEFLVSRNPDLILSIATPASQAVARATEDIPVVFTAVTCPYTSELVESFERPGRNVTGVSDLTPVAVQIDLLARLLPEARVIGLLYNAGEINSVLQANIAREAITSRAGFSYIAATPPSPAEVTAFTQSLVAQGVDVIYIPTCNTIAGAYASVIMIADEAGIPVIVGESAGVEAGALATEGIDYYVLGRQTADMAARILRGEAIPAEMPVEWKQDRVLAVNVDAATRLGITIPDDILQRALIITD